jgi:hypothetical protein
MKCGYHFLEEEISKILSEKEKEGGISKNSNKRLQFYPPKKQKIIKKIKSSSKSTNFLASTNISNKKKKKTKKNKKAKLKNISNKTKYTYNDFEINTFSYEKAISYDKRTFCEYYISLLKTKHPIIFSFCPIKDYNTIIIKSCIFTLSFSIYYTINFAFFDNDVIHKIYEEGGKYNILYFLPKISISFGISHIIYIIIKFLFLSERNILEVKIQPDLSRANDTAEKVKRNLVIKYIIFFILGIIFLIFFWMLLSSFGAVFQNTQIIVFENTLICIGISFIFPIFINIIPCIIRICSLNSKSKCFYNFSKFLQII